MGAVSVGRVRRHHQQVTGADGLQPPGQVAPTGAFHAVNENGLVGAVRPSPQMPDRLGEIPGARGPQPAQERFLPCRAGQHPRRQEDVALASESCAFFRAWVHNRLNQSKNTALIQSQRWATGTLRPIDGQKNEGQKNGREGDVRGRRCLTRTSPPPLAIGALLNRPILRREAPHGTAAGCAAYHGHPGDRGQHGWGDGLGKRFASHRPLRGRLGSLLIEILAQEDDQAGAADLLAQEGEDFLRALGIHAVGGLVQDQQPR